MNALLGPVMAGRLTPSVSLFGRLWRTMLLVATLFFVSLALARPWWGWRPVPAPSVARDVLLAIDCSRSMLASDLAPNRLEYAKWFCRRLIAEEPADRYGILAFAGDAYLECPLTRDRETLRRILEDLDTSTIPVGGTNVEAALRTARLAFQGAEGEHRAVVLVTDGEALQGAAENELEFYRSNGIPLFIVGLGDPQTATVVELADGRFLRDAAGEIVRTQLVEAPLKELAMQTDGVYVRADNGQRALDIVAEAVRGLTPFTEGARIVRQPVERYQIPLALGVLCLLARLCISERRRESHLRRSGPAPLQMIVPALFLSAMLSTFAGEIADTDGEDVPGVSIEGAGGDGETDEASMESRLLELKERMKDGPPNERPALLYMVGWLNQRLDRPDSAREAYRQAVADVNTDPTIRGFALWNLGIIEHEAARSAVNKFDFETAEARLNAAQARYREALETLGGERTIGQNLETLAVERKRFEEIKDMMEELQEKQKRAREKTADALQEQRQSRKRQDGGGDEAGQATREAEQAVEDLRQALEQAGAPENVRQPVEEAKEQIEKAQVEQRKATEQARNEESRDQADEAAERHLAEALRRLGGDGGDGGDEGDEGDARDEGDEGEARDEGDEGEEGEARDARDSDQSDQSDPSDAQAGEGSDQEIQPGQAGAILNQLQENEEDLRRAIKRYQMRNAPQFEKDW